MNKLPNGKYAVGAPGSQARKEAENEIGCSWCLPWRAGWCMDTSMPDGHRRDYVRCSCNPETDE